MAAHPAFLAVKHLKALRCSFGVIEKLGAVRNVCRRRPGSFVRVKSTTHILKYYSSVRGLSSIFEAMVCGHGIAAIFSGQMVRWCSIWCRLPMFPLATPAVSVRSRRTFVLFGEVFFCIAIVEGKGGMAVHASVPLLRAPVA